jgi:hypothetical protein
MSKQSNLTPRQKSVFGYRRIKQTAANRSELPTKTPTPTKAAYPKNCRAKEPVDNVESCETKVNNGNDGVTLTQTTTSKNSVKSKKRTKKPDHALPTAAGPSSIFIVRWEAHGSNVEDWDYEQLERIETCGDDIEEAKACITGGINQGGEAMLMADGLRKDSGVYPLAFSTIDQAHEGMKECNAMRLQILRHAIKKCCGMWDGIYEELLESQEIVEKSDGKGVFPPSARVMAPPKDNFDSPTATILDTIVFWGATGYNAPECNNEHQHELIRCCVSIKTQVTCWIESLECIV